MKVYQPYESPKQSLFVTNQMELMTPWYISLFLFLFGWLGLNVTGSVVVQICAAVWDDIYLININTNVITYVILALGFIIYLILYKRGNIAKALGRSFKDWKPYLFSVAGYFIMMAATAIVMIIISELYPQLGDNNNESAIDKMTELYFGRTFFMVVILAPFCEEMTYRYGLFAALRKKGGRVVAYLVAPLVFALIHFDFEGIFRTLMSSAKDMDLLINELLNVPSYLIAGLTLSAVYDLSGSISGSWILHVANNLIATLV